MTNEIVKQIMAVATLEEKETFGKVSRSTPEKVFESFGLNKDEMLEKFMQVWAMRAMSI